MGTSGSPNSTEVTAPSSSTQTVIGPIGVVIVVLVMMPPVVG